MILIVLGPQASGKGTQAKFLVKKLGCQYFESGDFLREIAKGKGPLARRIDQIINEKGILVPNKIMKRLVEEWLDKTDLKKGVVFDGHPRNISQYRTLEKMLTARETKVDRVIYLYVSRKVSVERMSARRICPKCDVEYNLFTKLPKRKGLCDQCREKLVQRPDDTPKVIKKRLEVYHQRTQPLINFVRKQKILEEVNGERPIKVIHQEILYRLKKVGLLGE